MSRRDVSDHKRAVLEQLAVYRKERQLRVARARQVLTSDDEDEESDTGSSSSFVSAQSEPSSALASAPETGQEVASPPPADAERTVDAAGLLQKNDCLVDGLLRGLNNLGLDSPDREQQGARSKEETPLSDQSPPARRASPLPSDKPAEATPLGPEPNALVLDGGFVLRCARC